MRDFVAAWTKVMNLDRFDLASRGSDPAGPTPCSTPASGLNYAAAHAYA